MAVESSKIYQSSHHIPHAGINKKRILTGGKFDWPFHDGHKLFVHALADIKGNSALFVDPDGTNELADFIPQIGEEGTELWVALTRDKKIGGRLDMRPILPEQVRARLLADLPDVTGIFLSDGNLSEDAVAIGADAVGFSTTTMGFEDEKRKETRDRIRALGMCGLVLPQLVNISTTKALDEFFLGKKAKEFGMVTKEGVYFPLLYAEEMVLTPDQSSVEIARLINEQLVLENKHGVRMLEMGVGSGIFTTALIVGSEKETLKSVHISDIDTGALAIADFNITRALAFKDMDPRDILKTSKSDWFTDLHDGRYDLVYVNPPFFTSNVNPPDTFAKNPHDALYPPNLTYHYEKILASLGEHMANGGRAVIRVPRTDAKVAMIKNVVFANINTNVVEMSEIMLGDGRYIILKFPFERETKRETLDEKKAIKERVETVLKIQKPEIKNWLSMTDKELASLYKYGATIQTKTSSNEDHQDLNADDLFWEHIQIMDKMIVALWENNSFREILPEGMNLNFLRSMVVMHDFSRLIFNSHTLLQIQDTVSEDLLTKLFPDSPLSIYMHSIKMITGESEIDEKNLLPIILKALDTLGKKGRDPKTLLAQGSTYVQKIKSHSDCHKFPMDIPVSGPLGGGIRTMDAAEYVKRDVALTLKGAGIIEALTGIDFMEFKTRALEQ